MTGVIALTVAAFVAGSWLLAFALLRAAARGDEQWRRASKPNGEPSEKKE